VEVRDCKTATGHWRAAFDLAFAIGFGSRVTGCDDYFL